MLWADGAYDSRRSFEFCRERGIKPVIRIGTNATTRSRGVGRSRTMAAYDRMGGGTTDPKEFAGLTHGQREANRKEWRKREQYGKRWLVEIVISSFKRLFGNSVRAVTMDNIIQEVGLKMDIYNRLREVQRFDSGDEAWLFVRWTSTTACGRSKGGRSRRRDRQGAGPVPCLITEGAELCN